MVRKKIRPVSVPRVGRTLKHRRQCVEVYFTKTCLCNTTAIVVTTHEVRAAFSPSFRTTSARPDCPPMNNSVRCLIVGPSSLSKQYVCPIAGFRSSFQGLRRRRTPSRMCDMRHVSPQWMCRTLCKATERHEDWQADIRDGQSGYQLSSGLTTCTTLFSCCDRPTEGGQGLFN